MATTKNKQNPLIETMEIEDISGGWNKNAYLDGKGTYDSAIGINPSYALNMQTKSSGVICPVAHTQFSSTNVTGFPLWLLTDVKDNYLYAYMSDGKYVRYSSTYTGETLIGTPTSGAGNGAAYYNNCMYLATPTDISGYMYLNGTPTLVNNLWTGSFLGSQTALANTTYPTLIKQQIPNHPMYVHVDNTLYVGDVNANGQGQIHRVKTTTTTVQGDTNNSSAYGALLLPFGFYPTAITGYGNDLVIAAIRTSSSILDQGESALFLWDTTSVSFYDQISLPDPLTTALLNVNGVVWIWGGNAVNGVRVSIYSGSDTITEEVYLQEGTPPFQGAVACLGNQVSWGAWTTYPTTSASVFSFDGALHNTAVSTSNGTNQNVTAIKFAQQSSEVMPQLVMGWGNDSGYGIDALSSTKAYKAVWRSDMININRSFKINRIRFGLGDVIQAGVQIQPNVYFDDQSVQIQLDPVNTTYFQGRYVIYKVEDFGGVSAQNNFMLEFQIGGTYFMPILLPIEIEYEMFADET